MLLSKIATRLLITKYYHPASLLNSTQPFQLMRMFSHKNQSFGYCKDYFAKHRRNLHKQKVYTVIVPDSTTSTESTSDSEVTTTDSDANTTSSTTESETTTTESDTSSSTDSSSSTTETEDFTTTESTETDEIVYIKYINRSRLYIEKRKFIGDNFDITLIDRSNSLHF